MTTITEIACEKCLRPLISPGSVNQTQEIATYGVFMTKCKHFYHQSCIRELYNTSTSANPEEPHVFICQHQKCATLLKRDQIFLIVPTLQSRTIDSVGSRPDENLKRDLKIAQDTINELKKMARQYSNDLTIAQSRIAELETKLKESNALYQKSILDKTICKIVHQRSTQTDTNTNVLLATSDEIPKGNTIQKNIHTLNVTNDESSDPQTPSCANAAARAPEPIAKQPTKASTKQLPIIAVNQMPETIANQTPKSMDNQNPNFNAPFQTKRYITRFNLQTVKTPANNESGTKQESEPKIPANIDRYSPAKEPSKRAPTSTSQTRERHIQFQERFKMDSEILKPFYPLNCYPLQYTAAGIRYKDEAPKIAILAKDVLMIGDGLLYGMVQFISRAIPFKFDLHPELYGRDLSIEDIVQALIVLIKLPPRIMLSIGNWDALHSVAGRTIYTWFQSLIGILRTNGVNELYLIPPIRYTTQDSSATFAYVVSLFQADCGNTFGVKTMLLEPPGFFQYPIVDKYGPMFELELLEPYVRYIRERFIPPGSENNSDDEVVCTYKVII